LISRISLQAFPWLALEAKLGRKWREERVMARTTDNGNPGKTKELGKPSAKEWANIRDRLAELSSKIDSFRSSRTSRDEDDED
jgi:hypothetical protein